MTEAVIDNDALVRRYGRHCELNAEPTAILWTGTTAAIALGDGSVRWIAHDGEQRTIAAHRGAVLSACRHPDGVSIVTGDDDGQVRRLSPDGDIRTLGQFDRKWIEHLVANPTSGLIAAAVGREAIIWTKAAVEPSHRFRVGSTIGGLALDAKGKRLAISHYNGATLFYTANRDSGETSLNWVGSHLACTMSPDGRYIVTALQETGLHGWRLPEKRDMAMSGYAAKTRSFSWDRRGRWLATGGDAAAILWPFEGKDGPMGKAPLLRGERPDTLVTRLAFHPRDEVLAIGYNDGVVVLARVADEHLLVLDDEGAPITALAWNDTGTRLGWGDEAGRIGLLDMEARA